MTGTLSPTIPTIGDPNSTEDPDIRSALITLRDGLNAVLTSSNTLDGATIAATTVPSGSLAAGAALANLAAASVTDAKLASPNNAVYKHLRNAHGVHGNDGVAATYMLGTANSGNGTMMVSGTATLPTASRSGPEPFYFDDADYTVAGLTQKLRVRAAVATNATASAITFTVGLYPVTVAGGTDQMAFTLGTVVTGSTVAIASPGASAFVQGTPTADFTVPADGHYLFGVVTSGTIANNSLAHVTAELQTRNV